MPSFIGSRVVSYCVKCQRNTVPYDGGVCRACDWNKYHAVNEPKAWEAPLLLVLVLALTLGTIHLLVLNQSSRWIDRALAAIPIGK